MMVLRVGCQNVIATNLAMMTTYADPHSNSVPDPAGGMTLARSETDGSLWTVWMRPPPRML